MAVCRTFHFDRGDYDLILSGPNVRSSARLDITDLILEQLQREFDADQFEASNFP